MKPNSGMPPEGTLAESRAWATGLCRQVERSARCFAYWDAVRIETANWPPERVWNRYGCYASGLRERWLSAFELFMEGELENW